MGKETKLFPSMDKERASNKLSPFLFQGLRSIRATSTIVIIVKSTITSCDYRAKIKKSGEKEKNLDCTTRFATNFYVAQHIFEEKSRKIGLFYHFFVKIFGMPVFLPYLCTTKQNNKVSIAHNTS